MATIQEKLETLFAKVRTLSEERQQLATSALSEIAEEDDVDILSDEERSILEAALREAERGQNLSRGNGRVTHRAMAPKVSLHRRAR